MNHLNRALRDIAAGPTFGLADVIAKTEPTSKLLNAMPLEQAREIYRAI